MSKTPPPLLGFNNNVRHRGRVFHIQTEDSGIKRPHIVTHLFGDGGRILKSVRTEYAEHLERDDLAAVVRKLMKEQHKALFIALRAGELDVQIEAALGPLPPREAVPPPLSSPIAAPSPEDVAASAEVLHTPLPRHVENIEPTPVVTAEGRPPSSSTIPSAPRTPVVHMLPSPVSADFLAKSPRPPSVPPRPASVPPRPASVPPPSDPRIPTPPPPSHSIDEAVEAMAAKAAGRPLPSTETHLAGEKLQKRRSRSDSSPGRYSISRPANIFEEAPPSETRSIFGDPLIGEKSLDEVILSYLAEDLENPQTK